MKKAALLFLPLTLSIPILEALSAGATAAGGGLQRGVCWVAHGPVTAADFLPLVEHHVDWISQTPFGWQQGVRSPEVRLITSGRIYWGETDEGLAATARLARRHGIRTLLKPHVWLRRTEGGAWRGEIAMGSEEDWRRWFASYRQFVLHYARLAEAHGMEALAVGTELRSTVRRREADWRRLIAEVREVYGGRLTYSANWYRELEEIPFWDALDFIGVQGYFPLTADDSPSLAALEAGWTSGLAALETAHQRWRKPVVFTEIGYKSATGCAEEPWKWNAGRQARGADALACQERAYEAFFRTFWDRDWVAGAYFWKWFPEHASSGGPRHWGFTPQNKPAARVMAEWYGRGRPGPVIEVAR